MAYFPFLNSDAPWDILQDSYVLGQDFQTQETEMSVFPNSIVAFSMFLLKTYCVPGTLVSLRT